ncbi:hypothetical protein VMF7928_01727 [Vibrio marisflavi CECT 7928]|uniref:Type II secretion system protein H n=1 Tax=Vibrio marisflavi CECT 7928 TaxID=634439 RepID=A0ABN8E5F6_9VIBR|nr:hypothetical protein VMF7928_01727 [Vibrio marisflavi CECT 7928]
MECLITLVLLTCLLSWAAPSFNQLLDSRKVIRFASELVGLTYLAKSEAIYRNQNLWLHLPNSTSSDSWSISLNTGQESDAETISLLSGEPYRTLVIESTYQDNQIKFYPRRGKVASGNVTFYSSLQPDKKLKLITSYSAGRVRLCSVTGSSYGYTEC